MIDIIIVLATIIIALVKVVFNLDFSWWWIFSPSLSAALLMFFCIIFVMIHKDDNIDEEDCE